MQRTSFKTPRIQGSSELLENPWTIETHLCAQEAAGLANGALAVGPVSCYKIDMEIKLTAVFRKFPEGYAAFVEELPGANTQGATLEEARENLQEAVTMLLQANRELTEGSWHLDIYGNA